VADTESGYPGEKKAHAFDLQYAMLQQPVVAANIQAPVGASYIQLQPVVYAQQPQPLFI